MIDVKIYDDNITVTGHAEAGPYGHDLVCSAVSCLVNTLIISLELLTNDGCTYDVRPGYASIYSRQDRGTESQTLIDGFICGVIALSQSYPKNIQYKDCRPLEKFGG